ncbi:8-oxo-dGTP diphosphatase MutT [Legionella sp. km772]|uniref:8-oxo-dGTP diphosphatase MutT n=1 Tax=Legionella sp. km772 TaxID=2498111 RepID=UPI000F8C64F6|nr:8-oxo-dGTP diphosphatase MutT [Legionella sp. km772]RUR12804.1 8-oxo-dGTP diphosphatase MutT [Legionella sp. km772]
MSIKVAVAIITDNEQRVLVAQRPLHVPQGGLWEFPGGKLEANESAEQALVREIKEEIGLEVKKCQLLGEINHQYPGKLVQLIVFHVSEFSGTASCLEGQLDLKWISKELLNPNDFPEANSAIFKLFSFIELLEAV